MKRLEAADPTEPVFERLLTGLIQDIRSHIGREETELFPRLRNACTTAELVALGDSLAEAKRTAPTRPHPTAPDTTRSRTGQPDPRTSANQHNAPKESDSMSA